MSEELNLVIKKVIDLISRFTMSVKNTGLLKQKTPNGIGLIKPVRTRWIYWFYVFDRVLKIKKYVYKNYIYTTKRLFSCCVDNTDTIAIDFRQLLEVCEEENIDYDISTLEWKLLQQLTDLLSPFATAVTRLEGQNYSTLSEVYPALFSLESKLNQVTIPFCRDKRYCLR